MISLYPNKLMNWEFANAEPFRFDSEKTAPLFRIRHVLSESKIESSAKEKTNYSTCLGIPKQVEESDLDASESSREGAIKNWSVLQYWPVFDRSKSGALAASKFRFFRLFGYILFCAMISLIVWGIYCTKPHLELSV